MAQVPLFAGMGAALHPARSKPGSALAAVRAPSGAENHCVLLRRKTIPFWAVARNWDLVHVIHALVDFTIFQIL
jgi:hypothetical protein